jgi:nitric oxide reductase activation protein
VSRICLLFAFCILLIALPCAAQFPATDPQGQPPAVTEQEAKLQREQAKKMNKQRHENLRRDADKLLELATQLKQYVDKSNENTLSVDVVKKADEIDKLARSVRDKMRGY